MFLEQVGKLCFSRIRPFFFFLFLLFPLLLVFFLLFFHSQKLAELEIFSQQIMEEGGTFFEKKERQERFLQRYGQADPYFLDHEIESFPLLQREMAEKKAALFHPATRERAPLRERLAFLEENFLSFLEEATRTSSQIKETEEKQRHPIQLNSDDLHHLLALLEDIPVGAHQPSPHSPQFLIQQFHLQRLDADLFSLEMNLIKREFFP